MQDPCERRGFLPTSYPTTIHIMINGPSVLEAVMFFILPFSERRRILYMSEASIVSSALSNSNVFSPRSSFGLFSGLLFYLQFRNACDQAIMLSSQFERTHVVRWVRYVRVEHVVESQNRFWFTCYRGEWVVSLTNCLRGIPSLLPTPPNLYGNFSKHQIPTLDQAILVLRILDLGNSLFNATPDCLEI